MITIQCDDEYASKYSNQQSAVQLQISLTFDNFVSVSNAQTIRFDVRGPIFSAKHCSIPLALLRHSTAESNQQTVSPPCSQPYH